MQVGDKIHEQFVLKQFIGRGAQGECWLVEEGTDVFWLAKIFRLGRDGWERYSLIEREARLLRQLDHPSIPRLRGLFPIQNASSVCLIREWVPGYNLEQFLEQRRIAEVDVRQIAAKLLDVLHYIHELSPAVIHRDIKPSNVIIDDSGQVTLIDFGSVRDTIYAEEGASIVGTYGYTPPEQFMGHPTPASDLYALGATLVYLLSRTHPAQLPLERNRLRFEPYVNVQPRFERILQRLLEPVVEDRFQSATEVLEAVQRCEAKLHDATLVEMPAFSVEQEQEADTNGRWQRHRQSRVPWVWEQGWSSDGDIDHSYVPDLQAVAKTLKQRHELHQIDEFSTPLDIVEAVDAHFGREDQTGREWLLRLLHPFDAADVLFGFYEPTFLLPECLSSLLERFSLLFTETSSNAVAYWLLFYFLDKHNWQAQRFWRSGEHLTLAWHPGLWLGPMKRIRYTIQETQQQPIERQSKNYALLHQYFQETASLFHFCAGLRPVHLSLIVRRGVGAFESEALPHYPTDWQEQWKQQKQARAALSRLTAWPPRFMERLPWMSREKQKSHELGGFLASLFRLYQELHRMTVFLRDEYHWLIPEREIPASSTSLQEE